MKELHPVNQLLMERCFEELAPLRHWKYQCHAASAKLVKADIFDQARVARGTCEGVAGQHSWVVIGMDCYDDKALIVDPTLWSYRDDVEGIWYGSYTDGWHEPHGKGNIFKWGRPDPAEPGTEVELQPEKPFSRTAQQFLDLLGPIDEAGWRILAHAPVEGWPAAEILPAINRTVGEFVPIDIIGMLTDQNPGGLYLKED
jgi:hypothetical protein